MTEQKCQHKWKIIREEEGYKHEFFHGDYYVIYHLQCKNCGKVIDFKAHSVCKKCRNNIKLTK